MKRMLVVLLLAMLLPAAALAENLQVIDDANLIGSEAEAQIVALIEQIEREHQVDIVVLTTYDVPDDYSDDCWRIQDYADDFYISNNIGMGEDFSGMLYMIDMNNRVPWITTGGVMIEYMNDYRIDRLHDAADAYLMNGNYAKAVLVVVQTAGEFLDQGRMKGSFIYDEATGQRLSGLYNPLEGYEIAIAAAAGAAVTVAFAGIVSARYSLKGRTYTYDLSRNSDSTMLRDDEAYLRQTVTRVARSSGEGGRGGHSGGGRSGGMGSRTHSSSGGRRLGGGGGRRF